jgi:tetratricopeptide (TPR) repeat protein
MLNRNAEAEEACKKAIDLQTRLAAEFGDPNDQNELCQSRVFLATVYIIAAKYVQADAEYKIAQKQAEALVAAHPDRPEYLMQLSSSLTGLSYFNSYSNRRLALELSRRAVAMGEKAVGLSANSADSAIRLASSYRALGNIQLELGRITEADTAVKRCRSLLSESGGPTSSSAAEYRWTVANVKLLAAQVALASGRQKEAEDEARQAVSALEAQTRRHPQFFPTRVQLEPAYTTLGSACWMAGKEKEADAAWYQAVGQGRRMAKDFPTFPRPVGNRDQQLLSALFACVHAKMEVARVVAAADSLANKKNLRGIILYDVACVYALASVAEKERPNAEYADRAMEVLRRPEVMTELRSNAGLRNHFRSTDRDLDGLRGRSDFREYLRQLEESTKDKGQSKK